MTQHINADWKPHVAATGVTCYTCHRGKAVPQQVWFKAPPQNNARRLASATAPARTRRRRSVGLTLAALRPVHACTCWSDQADPRRQRPTALPTGNRASIQHTEQTYGADDAHVRGARRELHLLPQHALVHDLGGPPPQRITAWHGIRMVRDLNNDYLEPLTKTFPANRLGPLGDVAKVNCATCHQGVNKPLYGAPMAKDYPELLVATSAQAKAADGLPPPVAEATRSVLYFGVGSSALEGEQAKGLALLIATMSRQAGGQGDDLRLPLGRRRPGGQPGAGQATVRSRCAIRCVAAGIAAGARGARQAAAGRGQPRRARTRPRAASRSRSSSARARLQPGPPDEQAERCSPLRAAAIDGAAYGRAARRRRADDAPAHALQRDDVVVLLLVELAPGALLWGWSRLVLRGWPLRSVSRPALRQGAGQRATTAASGCGPACRARACSRSSTTRPRPMPSSTPRPPSTPIARMPASCAW